MAQMFEREGGEFLANTTTAGVQGGGSVAALPGGGFVLVWQDGSGTGGDPDSGIKGQLFDAAGGKVGGEFLVNAGTTGTQSIASVVALSGGGFVVSWADANTAGADADGSVKARVFAADATPAGGEFLVNTVVTGNQFVPAIAALTSGGFVVAWQDPSGIGGDASALGIKAQRFDALGAPVGSEFLVNTTTPGSQFVPTIAAQPGGGFAIAWSSTGYGLVQLFDAAGVKVGGERTLVVGTPSSVSGTRVDALASGFIATWNETAYAGDPLGTEIKAQRFDAAGAKVGSVFAINAPLEGNQTSADILALPGGGFIAVWNSGPVGGITDVHAQVFDAGGQKVGTEFVVNSTTAGNQGAGGGGTIAVLASGDLVVTWSDGTTPTVDVKVQLLAASTAGASDIALSTDTVSEVAVENLHVALLSASGPAINDGSYSFTIVSDSTGGAFAIDGDRLVVADSALLDFETAPTAQVRVRATDPDGYPFEETLTINIANSAIEARYAAEDVFSAQGFDELYDSVSSVTPLASGGFLVARNVVTSGLSMGARGQIFDADGQPVGSDFQFSLPLRNNYEFPIAALAGGGFVAAFSAMPDGGFPEPVKVQRFDAAGNEVGGEVILDGGLGGSQEPSVTSLSSGGFVVTWLKYSQPMGSPVTSDVQGQLFDAAGAKVGSEFVVNTGLAETQYGIRSAALPSGGFVVVWNEYDPLDFNDPPSPLEGQIFDAAGAKVGGELAIAAAIDGPAGLAALAGGGFVVTWSAITASDDGLDPDSDDDDIRTYALAVQVVGADGVNLGAPIMVYPGEREEEFEPRVAGLPDGGFVVTWAEEDPAAGDGSEQVWGQFFAADGTLVGTRFIVDDSPLGSEIDPSVAVTTAGDVVFAWSLLEEDGQITSDAYARIIRPLGARGTPGDDQFDFSAGGDDSVNGGGGNDAFYFGGAFTAADTVDGGAGANDQIGLEGDYSAGLTLGAGTITGVEVIAVLPGFDYSLTTVNANVPSGGTLKIFAGNLGAGDNFTFNGSAELDGNFMVYAGAGTDIVTTGAGNDGIYFGPSKFDPLVDRVDGGAGTNDQLALDGHYAITLDGTAIKNIDAIVLLKGVPGDLATYNLTIANSLVGATETMTLWGTPVETAITINGAAETDGNLKIFGGTAGDMLTGGAGNDWFWGGLGGDTMTGGAGADTFMYEAAAESQVGGFDRLIEFDQSVDKIDLPFAVSGFAGPPSGGSLSAATMGAQLEAAFTGLAANQAAGFFASGGDMVGRYFVVVDANGAAGFQAGSDFVIEFVTPVTSPVADVSMFI